MPTLIDALEHFSASLPGFLSASVVHRDDGTSLGSVISRDDLDAEAADAYFAAMLDKNARALQALRLADDTEDVSLTTSEALFLVRVLPGTRYAWIAVTGRRNAMGLVRELMRRHQAALMQALP